MNATALQDFSIPLNRVDDARPMSTRAAVLELLAAMNQPAIGGYSHLVLFETSSPGAVDAFQAFASANQIELHVSEIASDRMRLTRYAIHFANGARAEVVK